MLFVICIIFKINSKHTLMKYQKNVLNVQMKNYHFSINVANGKC